MSEIKVNSIKGVGAASAAITINNSDGTVSANLNNNVGNKNLIINGAMQISQRNSTFTPANNTNTYTLDRFQAGNSNDGAYTVSQSTTAPDGFSNSLKVDITTADTSIGSTQFAQILHKVEAQNLQHLAFGTSAAKNSVLSFYVRSNKTGNYAVAVLQHDNSSKQVTFQYTINSADTWERKSFLIPGDTSGVINNDTGRGFDIHFGLAAGNTFTSGSTRSSFTTFADGDLLAGQGVNLLDSTSNEWYITGVQLELGSVMTDFDHRSAAQELHLCKRYFQQQGQQFWGVCEGTTKIALQVSLNPKMRASPTVTSKSGRTCACRFGNSDKNVSSPTIGDTSVSPYGVWTRVTTSGLSGGAVAFGRNSVGDSDAQQFLFVDSEL